MWRAEPLTSTSSINFHSNSYFCHLRGKETPCSVSDNKPRGERCTLSISRYKHQTQPTNNPRSAPQLRVDRAETLFLPCRSHVGVGANVQKYTVRRKIRC